MVSVVINNPDWFLNIDIIFATISIIVSLLITFVSVKAWFVIKRLRYVAWSIAFLALGFSFVARIVANIYPDPLIFYIGYGLHIMSTIFAFLTFFIVANRIYNARIVILLYLMPFVLIFFSSSYFMSFYVTTSIITLMLALTYFVNFLQKKKISAFCVFFAFLMLFLAHLQFLLSSIFHVLYISANVTQLLGFVLFLITLIKVLKS